MTDLITSGQRNMAIATSIANIVVGGIGFRIINIFLGLNPTIKTTLSLTTLFALSAIAIWSSYKVFFKKEQIPVGTTLIAAAVSSVIIVFTSKLGYYFVPASRMSIMSVTTQTGSHPITLSPGPILAGLLILAAITYLHEDTRKKVWKWLTEN